MADLVPHDVSSDSNSNLADDDDSEEDGELQIAKQRSLSRKLAYCKTTALLTHRVDHAFLLLVRAAAAEEADDENDRSDDDEDDGDDREGVTEEVDVRLQLRHRPATDDDEAQTGQLERTQRHFFGKTGT